MTPEQFEREKNYGVSMAVARMMLSKGLISERECRTVDTIFRKKYRPVIGGMNAKKP